MSRNISPLTRRMARSLKPLSRAEAKRARQTAIDYLRPELERDGKSRFRVLGAEMMIMRPKSRGAVPKRLIEVIVIDYQNRRHLRVVVDGARVVEAHELEGQPAFHAEEIAEAKAIAVAADPALRKLQARRTIFLSPFAPGACEPGQRRVGLRFVLRQKDGSGAIQAAAEVDLIEQKLLAAELYGKSSSTQLLGGNLHGRLR